MPKKACRYGLNVIIFRMIPQIIWARSNHGEPPSPFLRGETERPLRITFHTSSFSHATDEELEAIKVLRQLANLPTIEVFDTEAGALPYFELSPQKNGEDHLLIETFRPEGVGISGIPFPNQWPKVAAQIAGQIDVHHPETIKVLPDLLMALASHQIRQDIFVTLSPQLLAHRDKTHIRDTNPRSPSETAKIVGLYLRSREYYPWPMGDGFGVSEDHSLFYWVLARHKLPSLWRYLSACVQAEKILQNDILNLGQSILIRCARAIQARDAIGAQFYAPQGGNTIDTMIYHFEYLTLLLAGAFDAMARVAYKVYKINKPKERYASFRSEDFQAAVNTKGGQSLFEVITNPQFNYLMTLLYKLRNTIHGASFPTRTVIEISRMPTSCVTVHRDYTDDLWQAAEHLGSPENWGLKRTNELTLEPFTYSVNLVIESFRQIDAIANATDVTRLFDGYGVPPLADTPPDDDIFGKSVRKRLAALG